MILERYLSPENETSIFKGIPIWLRYSDEIRNLMMTRKFSVKYRGKSKIGAWGTEYYKRPQSHCHKDHAETFTIYPYSNY